MAAHFYVSLEEVQDEYDAKRGAAGADSGTANDPFSFDFDDAARGAAGTAGDISSAFLMSISS